MKYKIKQNENIKDQLKEVYKDPQIVNFVKKANELGYITYEPFFHEWENMKGEKRLILKLNVSSNEMNDYTPEIRVYDKDVDGEFHIKIQTTSYGSLNEQEFSKFLEAQNKAVQMRELIKDVYKNKSLPILEKI